MSSNYSLNFAPEELSEAPLTVTNLRLGTNEQPIILRLLNFWMQTPFNQNQLSGWCITSKYVDVVGRLASVSETETGTFGMQLSVHCWKIQYILGINSGSKKCGPVLLAFTSMVVVEASGRLCLLNTAATRVTHGAYQPHFRHFRDAFSHDHNPVVIGHSPTPWPVHIRYKLPAKMTLMNSGAAEKKLFPPYNSSVWCLITIESIPTCTSHYHYPFNDITKTASSMSYVATPPLTSCCSSTMMQRSPCSKKTTTEFLALTNTARNACLQSVIGKMFTVEIDTGEDSNIATSVFAVHTIWDPLAFAI
ncbi:unnamed protein product [Linum trigynum]|uniref:Uncharacterized protein n=1 Tax=Linum trigynum TaxID=586398 RepID=A0AAV2D948_9ROSI